MAQLTTRSKRDVGEVGYIAKTVNSIGFKSAIVALFIAPKIGRHCRSPAWLRVTFCYRR
jgi:hypothetical protein